ncbi:MAG TPA: U32 family peptidase [Candidatus Absconditabacterales bacterium]|nr:U32 family peptidase [Candidatus Absconditabacterales bacterium]
MNKPTIVAPGGSYEKAVVASKYGAEEVYIGVPFTSLRMRQNKVKDFDDLQKTIDAIHENGSKALLTMNIFPRNTDIAVFESVVERLVGTKPDAIIFSDPGTFNVIRKHFPDTPLHLSTQASTLNYESIKFRRDLGIKRVILARELNIEEIKEIRKHVPDIELEVFVHGAMCMSYSGRCLLGDYMAGRQANKGECNHACRFKYKVWLEEERRPGKLFQLENDENGSYILSSKDLCTIDKLEEILPYVDAIKIEGRSKSEFYVGAMVKAYKTVRDAIVAGEEPDLQAKELVEKIPHRPYWDGFLFNDLKNFPEGEEEQVTSTNIDSPGPTFCRNYFGIFKDNFIEKDGKKYYEFNPKEVLERGMKLKFLNAEGMGELEIVDLLKEGGQELDRANCNTPKVFVLTDREIKGWEILYK